MIVDNLYQKVLIDPLRSKANRLLIVSGYASATMASKHIKDILDIKPDMQISLIIGMCPAEGMDLSVHEGFLSLIENPVNVGFECKYVLEPPAVHSKVYVWCQDDRPVSAYTGSANYTQPGFLIAERQEAMTPCDPAQALSYYDSIEPHTIYCNHGEVEEYIVFTKRKAGHPIGMVAEDQGDAVYAAGSLTNKVTLSLLQKGGDVASKSGLNWGQRPGREPNQAYIPLPVRIARSGFFPLNKTHFMVMTDDHKCLILRVEQQNDKALATPLNNALLGEYFRNRLGLANGQFIRKEDLLRYGRTDIDFYKIDDETFYMDFSVSPKCKY